ncbi:hypothetical protein HWV62_20980 [Athelia sp. TMB]|nr:hypothetical protein HWV62_20980 [Athelia sp. TMB]
MSHWRKGLRERQHGVIFRSKKADVRQESIRWPLLREEGTSQGRAVYRRFRDSTCRSSALQMASTKRMVTHVLKLRKSGYPFYDDQRKGQFSQSNSPGTFPMLMGSDC